MATSVGYITTDTNAPTGACVTGSLFVFTGTIPSLYFCSGGSWVQTPVVKAYDPTGNAINGVKFVIGTGALTLGSATVNLTGNAVFTSSTSYNCQVSDTSGISLITVTTYNSGSQFTVGAVSLSLNDSFRYICSGN